MDAMACAMPCISSHSGSRGLESQCGQAFMCVPDDDPAAMAEAILALLASPARAQHLAAAGLSFVRTWNDSQIQSLRRLFGAKDLDRESAGAGRPELSLLRARPDEF